MLCVSIKNHGTHLVVIEMKLLKKVAADRFSQPDFVGEIWKCYNCNRRYQIEKTDIFRHTIDHSEAAGIDYHYWYIKCRCGKEMCRNSTSPVYLKDGTFVHRDKIFGGMEK